MPLLGQAPSVLDRATACLKGVAIGDAIGKQTETLSHENVRRWYPQGIRGFEGTPGSIIPRYVGNRKHEWRIGETTDDTERTIAVARAIIHDGRVSHVSVGREMLACTKSVHPGVRSLWEFHQAGDPARVDASHDGCGAAVRSAPVGIVCASHALQDLVAAAREASISTHGGSRAVAAAAATAAAVSAAIDEASPDDVLDVAEQAAARAERQWPGEAEPAFAPAIRTVHDELASLPSLSADRIAASCFPSETLTIVPLALSLATLLRSAEEAALLAANVGGDSDSVASIASGILGALYPATINAEWHRIVETVNHHDLTSLAHDLVRLRGHSKSVLTS